MDKVFVKKDELKLVNGGYVVLTNDETPVSNLEFIKAQKYAEYIVEFANEAKGKDFVGKKPDSLQDVRDKVRLKVDGNKDKKYIESSSAPKMDITKKLEKEALDFIKFSATKGNTDKVNSFLQSFNVINEFEEFGLFFEKDIVKLSRIYTMKEVIDAAKAVVDLV